MSENKDNALDQAIKTQVEFYFSNSNLPRDKFLLTLTKENDGWVPISTIATFKKMKQLTSDLDKIVSVLRSSDSLTVSDDGSKVKRKDEIPDSINDTLTAATVYAKGFPTDSTIEAIQKVFIPHGNVKCVRLRKYKSNGQNIQKDSAFIEFSSQEEAKKVAALTIPSLLDPKVNLKLMTKTDYLNMKAQESKDRKGKTKKPKKKDEETEPEEKKVEVQPDLIIQISNLGEGVSRENMKAYMEKLGAFVGFVDFQRGKSEGFIRLSQGKASEIAKKASESTEQLSGKVPTLAALTGEPEQQYWQKIQEMKKKNTHHKGKKGQGKKPNNKQGGKKPKRKDDSNNAEEEDKPKSKKHKIADDTSKTD